MQLAHVYLNWFRRNSLLKCVSQPKIAKKFIKPSYFSFQGHPRSMHLVAIESQYDFLLLINNNIGPISHRY